MRKPKLPFRLRVPHCRSVVTQQLCEIIASKKSNLTLAADVIESNTLLQLADQLGPVICLLKTHIDILVDFQPEVIAQLQTLATQHRFLIFEDRKFADIGSTVQYQYQAGVYHISDWADLVTVHAIAGFGTLAGLQAVAQQNPSKPRGALLIAEMSSMGQLTQKRYREATVAMAKEYPELISGFIAQSQVSDDPGHLILSPGVQRTEDREQNVKGKSCVDAHRTRQFKGEGDKKGDSLGQRYRTPRQAIDQGCDVVIVGRGIITASDPLATAEQYRQSAWAAYTACI